MQNRHRMLHFFHSWWRRLLSRDSGYVGERLAARWLQRERGFTTVARNWRSPHDRRDELDLVCRDRDVLVFVEVKSRAAGALVPGYFAVGARKKRVMLRAAESYLAGMRPRPRTFRCDVVEIITHADASPEVLHFENVPLFRKTFRAGD